MYVPIPIIHVRGKHPSISVRRERVYFRLHFTGETAAHISRYFNKLTRPSCSRCTVQCILARVLTITAMDRSYFVKIEKLRALVHEHADNRNPETYYIICRRPK